MYRPLEVVGDLTKSADVNNLIDATIKTYGKLDVLVNNAGIRKPANITQPDILQIWDQTEAINMRAIIELTHLAVPHLDKTNGSIIDISAVNAYAPIKYDLAYSVSKAALEMSTKILALELAPKGIRVNNVSPGVIQDRDKVSPEQQMAIGVTPLARLGQPLDVAKAVIFLASTDAQFITGASIIVDGGVVFNAGVANILDRPN
ncbi:unnamed protein product [Medioppia subpectinata]|uniref:Uncharacterized protein n=1 Tax=Medioppia subpectinata TaxID=1979941 RepID=A0A7R9KLI7_9ACAR|nr:unnamed protein product [Medioppia subpectinata]CAG2105482.1 unnamed protein product [Medioppia subpectinata]